MDEMRFSQPKITPPNPLLQQEGEETKLKIWRKIRIKKSWLLGAIVGIVIAILAATATILYLRTQELESQSQSAALSEVQEVVSEVAKLIVLPEDEEPTVATISDIEKLKGQAFFGNAKNGDKVLIFSKAGKAILYDPVAKKIVEVAPLNMQEND